MIVDWLVVSEKANQNIQSDVIHLSVKIIFTALSNFYSVFLFFVFKALSFAVLLVSSVLGHLILRL